MPRSHYLTDEELDRLDALHEERHTVALEALGILKHLFNSDQIPKHHCDAVASVFSRWDTAMKESNTLFAKYPNTTPEKGTPS